MLVPFSLFYVAFWLGDAARCAPTAQPSPVAVAPVIPSGASPPIDREFPGFAFEEASFYLYATDENGNPNRFSYALIENVLSRTGGTPYLRVGGTSGDAAHYNSTQQQPAVPEGRTNSPLLAPPFLSLGPKFFTAFRNFPGFKYIFLVPLIHLDINNTLAWTQQGLDNIPKGALDAVEIGNEPDLYPGFTPAGYVNNYTSFQKQILAKFPQLGSMLSFQALDYAFDNTSAVTVQAAYDAGLNQTGQIKQVAYHYYENIGNSIATEALLQYYVVNHTRVKTHMQSFVPDISTLRRNAPAAPFLLDENANSITLGNESESGNVLGTALWNVDFQMQAMTIGVTRINMQQIFTTCYSMWIPQPGGPFPAGVRANYYSQPMIGDIIGRSGNTRVIELNLGTQVDADTMSGYAIYDNNKLARIVLINMKLWSSTTDGPRPAATFTLSGLPNGYAIAQYLTAPEGTFANTTVTYAGQQWQYPSGKPVQVINNTKVLPIQQGELTLSVNATSAVLLNINEKA